MARNQEHDNAPHAGEALTSYCFGGLSEAEREEVERHLMVCEVCWDEFQHLDAAVRTLRFDAKVKPTLPVNEVVSLLGLSSRLERPLGGHLVFALVIAALYGLEWTLGLWTELGYAYDRYGTLAFELSAPVAVWVTGSLLVALLLDVKATRDGEKNGLVRSTVVALAALGAAAACLMLILPKHPTIVASFQTRTAAIGYFKDAVLLFLPLLLFILPPFHTVIFLQRELRAGRPDSIRRLFMKPQDRLVPRGLWYLSHRFLTTFLLAVGTLKVLGMSYMLDALKPGPYTNVFSVAAYVSTGVWLLIGAVSLAWYSASLNELKREALALSALTRREPDGREH